MPIRAMKACAEPRCPELLPGGGPSKCQKHRRERWRHYEHYLREPRDKKFYHSAGWLKARQYVLGNEPLCRECTERGLVVPATEVDHLVPMAKGGAALDSANLVPLCLACHSRKTMAENRAAGKL